MIMNTVKLKKLQSATTRLMMAIALFLLCACEKEEKDFIIQIPETETSWNVGQKGENITIHFTASAAWTAEITTEATAWMKISPNKGNAGTCTIQVEIPENMEGEPRTGRLILRSNEEAHTITFIQEKWKLQTGSEGIDDMPIEQW